MPGGSLEARVDSLLCDVAASFSILDASSFTLSKLRVIPEPEPASNINPLSMLPISPSSFSASGKTPHIPTLTLRSTPIAGPNVFTMSPNSVTVFILRETWSNASLAFIVNFAIFRTSASSLAYMFACAVSCWSMRRPVWRERLVFLGESFVCLVDLVICISSFLTAKSKRGFSGCCCFTDPRIVLQMSFLLFCFPIFW